MLRRKGKRTRPEDGGDFVAAKRPRAEDDEDELPEEREKVLDAMVFGARGGIVSALTEKQSKRDIAVHSDDDDDDLTDEEDYRQRRRADRSVPSCEAAWEDDDDAKLQVDVTASGTTKKLRATAEEDVLDGQVYSDRLRAQFKKVVGEPMWAKVPAVRTVGQGSDGGAEVDLLQRTQPILAGKAVNLPKDILEIRRVKDINWSNPPDAAIQAVQFHPQAPVALTAGLHKTLRLYHVDNETNPMLHSLYLKRFPIHSAQFSADGEQIIMTSRRPHFNVFDIQSNKTIHIPGLRGRQEKSFEVFAVSPDNELLAFTGRDGSVLLVSQKSKQLVSSCRMSGSAVALSFTPSGRHLLSAGSDGRVYVWDVNSRRCCHSFIDEGSFHLTSLAVGPDNKYVACGNSSGVVNVYDESCLSVSEPKPLRTLNNLAPTCVTSMQFNPSGEILAMLSRRMEKGLRLAHFPSTTVFSNWPKQTTKLNHAQCMAFSPTSEFMAVGNDRGKALTFRLGHYKEEN